MSIQISDIVLLVAAAQGLFLTVIIFVKFSKIYSVRFVGILILLYSIVLISLFINDLGYSIKISQIYLLFTIMPFLIGPLHYLFALHLINPNRRLKLQDYLHFFPGVILLIFLLINHNLKWFIFLPLTPPDGRSVLPPILLRFNWLITIHAFCYIIMTFRILKIHSREMKQMFSSVEKIQLNWVFNITYLALITLGIFFSENSLMSIGINFSNNYTLSSIVVAFYVYTFGYLVLIRSEIFTDPSVYQCMNQISEKSTHISSIIQPKYQKSGLTNERAQEYKKILLEFMDKEKPYRDNGLTLNQLGAMVNISPHNLSEIFNTQFHQNFFDFINSYRLEDVKQALIDGSKQHLTILALAFDAGFNSKTSFNTIFKKYVHMTPSEYRSKAYNNLFKLS